VPRGRPRAARSIPAAASVGSYSPPRGGRPTEGELATIVYGATRLTVRAHSRSRRSRPAVARWSGGGGPVGRRADCDFGDHGGQQRKSTAEMAPLAACRPCPASADSTRNAAGRFRARTAPSATMPDRFTRSTRSWCHGCHQVGISAADHAASPGRDATRSPRSAGQAVDDEVPARVRKRAAYEPESDRRSGHHRRTPYRRGVFVQAGQGPRPKVTAVRPRHLRRSRSAHTATAQSASASYTAMTVSTRKPLFSRLLCSLRKENTYLYRSTTTFYGCGAKTPHTQVSPSSDLGVHEMHALGSPHPYRSLPALDPRLTRSSREQVEVAGPRTPISGTGSAKACAWPLQPRSSFTPDGERGFRAYAPGDATRLYADPCRVRRNVPPSFRPDRSGVWADSPRPIGCASRDRMAVRVAALPGAASTSVSSSQMNHRDHESPFVRPSALAPARQTGFPRQRQAVAS